uniref:Uncharacterized protein n=1 Tax=Apteryx owenii TaxID=8824 RepID=A0A8B9QYT4_APTOW
LCCRDPCWPRRSWRAVFKRSSVWHRLARRHVEACLQGWSWADASGTRSPVGTKQGCPALLLVFSWLLQQFRNLAALGEQRAVGLSSSAIFLLVPMSQNHLLQQKKGLPQSPAVMRQWRQLSGTSQSTSRTWLPTWTDGEGLRQHEEQQKQCLRVGESPNTDARP